MINIEKLPAYTLIKTEEISELKSTGYLLIHNKTKARVAIMANDDENKVFSVGFRTPVSDSTGVPHIVEHSVLCGSEKYPLKDPFVELLKGSLNTFMNAMTFPDKTIYPIASCNDKDFMNLMDVYLDAVFNPLIYNREEIFLQEGWNYKINENDELKVNGIVYNEMKGVFSKPEEILMSKSMAALFPDNNYGYESGGDPEHIIDLTYDEFLDFHKRYYHPSNSFIYLYGNMDIEEKLNYIDKEYLSKFDYLEIDSTIKEQKPFDEIREVEAYYPIGENENEDNKTYFAYLNTAGDGTDKELFYAMKVLEYTLVSMPGAPLKKALIDAGIGEDVFGGEQNIKQRFFNIVAKCANINDKTRFKEIIENTLADIVKNGIDKDSLKAALNVLEFNYREADFGSYPKGVFYLIDSFESWLYDENEPFTHLKAADTFKFLNDMVETDYYEKLIEKYFINNTHKVLFTLLPKKGLAAINEEKLSNKMKSIKESMSSEEIENVKSKSKKLDEFHEMEESEENLNKIPTLTLEDIKKEAEKPIVEEKEFNGEKLLYSDITTNGIAYINVSFNTKNIDEELIPYLGLFKFILGNVDTSKHTYTELANIINMNSGGLGNEISSFTKSDSEMDYDIYFETNIKVLYDKIDIAFEIIKELLLDTKYNDDKRIKEIIAETKGALESAIVGRGHVKAMIRAMGRFSESSYYADKLSGIDFYLFVKDLYKNFDVKKDEILTSLNNVKEQLFLKENMLVHVTCEKEAMETFENKLSKFYCDFLDGKTKIKSRNFEPKFISEGIGTSQSIQFVARCGEYISQGYKYNGHFNVLSNILDYGYLWENIRDKGGAYGCMYKATRTGKITLASYRDPMLRETNDVYEGLPEYLRNFQANERDMIRYIIGAISSIDAPKTPRAKGAAGYNSYMSKISYDDIKKHREELLSTTCEDIRDLAKSFETALANSAICVIGNINKIKDNKDMFTNVIDLFE